MRRAIFAIGALAFWISAASAQSPAFRAVILDALPKQAVAPAGFTGTGDVVGGFNTWWSPGIAYSAAYAAGLGNAADVCDSGGTNCITLKVGSNGLVAAPGATACGGNPCVSISKLYDQSGANYCAGPCDLVQATNALRPILRTTCGGGTNMLCAGFTTSGGFVLTGPTLPAIAQPFTVSGVVKEISSNTSTSTEILSTPCASLFGESNDGISSNTFQIGSTTLFNNTTTKLSTLNTIYALTAVYNGASGVSSVNGTQTTANDGVAAWTGGATALGFAGCFTGTKWGGDALEIGIKGAGFNGTQITNVSSQQHTNWGF